MVVAFATLRGGSIAGTTALGIGLVLIILVASFTGLPSVELAVLALLCWVPTAVSAEVLRRTSSLPAAIFVIAGSALAIVAVLSALHEPMHEFWQLAVDRMKAVWTSGDALSPMTELKSEQLVSLLQVGAGISVLSVCTAGLFFGRSGQAKLFNPGGFQREFHAFYIGKQVGIFLVVLVLMGFFVGGALGLGMITVGLFPLLLQGLAVIHALVKERSLGSGWLAGVYLLLLFVQPVVILISGFGLIDNLRRLPRH